MRELRCSIIFVMMCFAVAMIAGCSCSDDGSLSGSRDTTGSSSPSESGGKSASGSPGSSPSGSSSSSNSNSGPSTNSNSVGNTNNSSSTNSNRPPPSNSLTAGSVDDHLNFDFFKKYLERTQKAHPVLPVFEPKQASPRFVKSGKQFADLDLVFVVDTTGSMTDELRYLTTEISYIASQIRGAFTNLGIRFALVVYRDQGDDYVTRVFKFSASLSDFQKSISAQQANGGGNYPEAAHEGLAQALQLSWKDSASKVVFWVADAPPHNDKMKTTLATIKSMGTANIRLYPVAASGVMDVAEYLMRVGAFITGGQYLFLTDDSGIGNSHAEPHVLCYHVETLKDLIVRMIKSEVLNQRLPPTANQIIRTVGSPKDGVCQPQ